MFEQNSAAETNAETGMTPAAASVIIENEKKPIVEYDARAVQRYEFEIVEGGEKFETAHVYKPLTDERYLSFLKSVKISDDEEKNAAEATERAFGLWRDLIEKIENVAFDDGTDFRDFVDPRGEAIPALENYLAVAVVESDVAASKVRQLGAKPVEQTITTEAFFSGKPVRQTHVLRRKTDELERKYRRILNNQVQEEKTRGLRRAAKTEYVPQDEAKGTLYDEMLISATNFADGIIPLRFKTRVVDYIFEAKLDQKK